MPSGTAPPNHILRNARDARYCENINLDEALRFTRDGRYYENTMSAPAVGVRFGGVLRHLRHTGHVTQLQETGD